MQTLQRRREAGTKAVCSMLYLCTEITRPFAQHKRGLKIIKDKNKVPPNNIYIKPKKGGGQTMVTESFVCLHHWEKIL